MIKIVSYLINMTREIEKKNKEELMVELLTINGEESVNIDIFKRVEIKFRKHLEEKKEKHIEQIESINAFNYAAETTEDLNTVAEKIEACGYEIEFVKK